MKATFALLCDAATVREGLLNILGGGISSITADRYPVSLPVTLVILLTGAGAELEGETYIEVRIEGAGGAAQSAMLLQVQKRPGVEPRHPELPVSVPLVVPLNSVLLNMDGQYALRVRLGGEEVAAVVFTLQLAQALEAGNVDEDSRPDVGTVAQSAHEGARKVVSRKTARPGRTR